MRITTKISLIFILLILPVLSSAMPAHNYHQNTVPSNTNEVSCLHCCESIVESTCPEGGQCQCDITQASYSLHTPASNIAMVSPHSVYKHDLPNSIAFFFQDYLYRPPIVTL